MPRPNFLKLFPVFLIIVITSSRLHAQDPTLEARKQTGQQVYSTICLACHQPTGAGIPGMFPPLAGSDWVAAKKPDRLIRLVLHGVVGPISVNGKPFPTPAPIMPPQSTLTDAQVADVLTYVRAAFGNGAAAVSAAEVAAVRQAEAARRAPWTEAELLNIPAE
jgi:mono/diheme cytochrome c family protein